MNRLEKARLAKEKAYQVWYEAYKAESKAFQAADDANLAWEKAKQNEIR